MSATNVKSQWVNGDLYFYDKAGNEIIHIDGTNTLFVLPGQPMAKRFHVAIADVNAGLTLLPAIAGLKYRFIDSSVMAVGGSAAALTLLTILGTQAAGSAILLSHTQASLTQSTLLKPTSTGAVVLADGASYIQNDVNTAVTIGKTGSSLTTSTFIDVILTYALEV